MIVIEKALNEITPYENNPRNNAPAVDAVVASIEEFGFKVPIVIDKDGVIVAGHTRYIAAQKLGLETVPCIMADDLSDEQVKAFRLADNKVSELAMWDNDKLIQELGEIDMDMSAFGFEDDLEMPTDDELDAKEVKADNPIMIKITFKDKKDMQKIEEDLREYIDDIDGASVVVNGGISGDNE